MADCHAGAKYAGKQQRSMYAECLYRCGGRIRQVRYSNLKERSHHTGLFQVLPWTVLLSKDDGI